MPIEMIDRFEEIDEYKYSVNVFQLRDAQGVEGEMRDKQVDVLRITTVRDAQVHINLLYLEEDDKAHYVLIKDFDRLMFGQHNKNKIKKHFCHYCLHCFRKGETKEKHLENGCYALAGERFKMPKEGEKVKFENIYNKFKVPFVVYLDFEAAPIPFHYVPGLNENTVRKANHEVVSYCLNVVSSIPGITFEPVLYRGYNAVENLFDNLKMLEIEMLKHFKANEQCTTQLKQKLFMKHPLTVSSVSKSFAEIV